MSMTLADRETRCAANVADALLGPIEPNPELPSLSGVIGRKATEFLQIAIVIHAV